MLKHHDLVVSARRINIRLGRISKLVGNAKTNKLKPNTSIGLPLFYGHKLKMQPFALGSLGHPVKFSERQRRSMQKAFHGSQSRLWDIG
jgi:hypothetical protein